MIQGISPASDRDAHADDAVAEHHGETTPPETVETVAATEHHGETTPPETVETVAATEHHGETTPPETVEEDMGHNKQTVCWV